GQARVERQADRRPERHDDIEEHRHPCRRHVDEDDAVGLALLRVGRRDEEADVEARERQRRGEHRADARDLPGEREEGLRRGVPEPVHAEESCPYSTEILRAAAIAQGANAAATTSIAPSSRSCPCPPNPAEAISTAPAPMISAGT